MRLHVDGLERRYLLHVPHTWDGRAPLPVVMVFHGGGGTASGMVRMTSWLEKADEHEFLAIFPNATSPEPSSPAHFTANPQIWNDGSGREHAGKRNINDVGFVEAILDRVESGFPVDNQRVFATGFSNGAFMVSRLGIELGHRIAAIGPVSGIYWLKNSQPVHPVSVICIVGAADPLNPLSGGHVTWPWGGTETQPGVMNTIPKWTELARCEAQPVILRDCSGVRVASYRSGSGECEVALWTVEEMGHTWPGSNVHLPERIFGKASNRIQACEVIWNFFESHPKNVTKP